MIAKSIVDPGDLKSIVKNLRKYGEFASSPECESSQLGPFRPTVVA